MSINLTMLVGYAFGLRIQMNGLVGRKSLRVAAVRRFCLVLRDILGVDFRKVE